MVPLHAPIPHPLQPRHLPLHLPLHLHPPPHNLPQPSNLLLHPSLCPQRRPRRHRCSAPVHSRLSLRHDVGSFTLLIKRYKRCVRQATTTTAPSGAVSNHLFNLLIGSPVLFKHISFNVKIPYKLAPPYGFEGVRKVVMISVGVGIAPMIQSLNELLAVPPSPLRPLLQLACTFSWRLRFVVQARSAGCFKTKKCSR